MEREIGSSYPQSIGALGPIELFTEYVSIEDLTGVYLRYLVAAVSTKNKVVNLLFNASLKPYSVKVVTTDGEEFRDWKLENYDKEDFCQICEELELDSSNTRLEEFARKLLFSIAPQPKVPVPAYRFCSERNA